jgi:hypothetical protein
MSSNTDYMTITSENRDFGVKVKSKKMLIVDYKKSGEGIGGLRVYTCNSKDLGNILIEEELTTMTGKVMYDRDRDGTYEEIYVLESISN